MIIIFSFVFEYFRKNADTLSVVTVLRRRLGNVPSVIAVIRHLKRPQWAQCISVHTEGEG